MKIKVLSYTILVFLLVLISGLFITCKKTYPPKAVIYVKDANGVPVADATIRVFSDPKRYHGTTSNLGNVGYVDPGNNQIEIIQYSDEGGAASFEFKNECILNVSVKLGRSRTDTIRGEGALVLKNNETTTETIILR